MDLVTYKHDVWGREVILGVSWDLLWVVIVAAFVVIVVHAVVVANQKQKSLPSPDGKHIKRHDGKSRVFHWAMAGSVFVLLITGIFPIIGIEFGWLTIHWAAGLVLTASVLYHIVRALFRQDIGSMRVTPTDISEGFDETKKPGKYSIEQKAMHAMVTVLILLVVGSGMIMFAMIDTPWWDRTNALSEAALGWTFLIHGLSTLALIGVISLHIYFALRPEKLFYTRSMIKGWISEDELKANHDPEKWPEKSA